MFLYLLYFTFLQNACGAKIGICRALLNRPDVVSIGVVWDSERPPADQVYAVLKAIGTSLRLCDVFHHVSDSRWAQNVEHELVGIISYYGKHYTTFFFHTKLKVWVYFDDANVKEVSFFAQKSYLSLKLKQTLSVQVGPNWESVVEKCSRGRYQPLLLLYATPQPSGSTPAADPVPSVIPVNRRAITPSPEKPPMGNNRRAITPTPNRQQQCDYQNLNVIQANIFPNDDRDEYVRRQSLTQIPNLNLNTYQDSIFSYNQGNSNDATKEGYVSHQSQMARKQQLNLHRSLSAESTITNNNTSVTSHPDGLSIPEHLNQPRRRDSGNWSGDRNSASSSSSTTHENPYLYLVNKRGGGGSTGTGSTGSSSHPPSPTRNGQIYDAGYDSYSLSSTDSYPPKQHNSQLAKIPESIVLSGDCERLCLEADQLLEKSKITEDCHDLETALVLCNAAAGKSRAAMDAPYSNPHTMTFARMKHNTCVMRARSLHRRILIEKGADLPKEQQLFMTEIRHTREGSNNSLRHAVRSTKNIEIYATLPKKGKSPLKLIDSEIIEYEKPKPERESRSLFGRGKRDDKDKRSRSEDRNKVSKEFSIAEPLLANAKDTLKKHKEDKEEKKDKDKTGKKQHKIRRKLLMGGLIRRKNRSMPDLTEANAEEAQKNAIVVPVVSVDDSAVGMGSNNNNSMNSNGYLSEGHFEYQTITSSANPNLERSKLMRKSFHGSGRQLTQVKVPPPPPLRTNSTLSQQQLQLHHQQQQQQHEVEAKIQPFHQANASIISNMSSNTSMSEDSCQTIITCAVVHQEQSPLRSSDVAKYQTQHSTTGSYGSGSVDEVDCRYGSNLELPPYPSPPVSTLHSRQASEDFPPPPMDIEPANDRISDTLEGTTSILAQLQQRQQLNKQKQQQHQQLADQKQLNEIKNSETWLKELQIKQTALRSKQQQDQLKNQQNASSVRDLASRFEQIKFPELLQQPHQQPPQLLRSSSSQELLSKPQIRTGMSGLPDSLSRSSCDGSVDEIDFAPASIKSKQQSTYLTLPKTRFDIAQSQIAEEIREVEMLNAVVQQTLNNSQAKQRAKKKSVSFCDQVILVATAGNQEDDDFIPNPILERVLRTANYNSDDELGLTKAALLSQHQQQNIMRLQTEPALRQGINQQLPKAQTSEVHRQNLEIQKQMLDQQQRLYGLHEQQPKQPLMPVNQSPISFQHQQQSSEQMNRPQIYTQAQDISRMLNAPDAILLQQQQQQRQIIANVGAGSQHLQINNPDGYAAAAHLQQMAEQQRRLMMSNGNVSVDLSRVQYDIEPQQQSPYMHVPQPNGNYMQNRLSYPSATSASTALGSQQQAYVTATRQAPQLMQQSPAHRSPTGNFINNAVGQQQQHSPNTISYPNGYDLQKMSQHSPTNMFAYQRIPMGYNSTDISPQQQYCQPSQQLLMQQSNAKAIATSKKVSFEPGTKGGSDNVGSVSPQMTMMDNQQQQPPLTAAIAAQNVTAIPTRVFNNNAIVKASAKAVQCNLCRKKHVIAPAIYCTDCEFYMSRFQPNRR